MLLAALNVVPIAVAIIATRWAPLSDNCPAAPYDGAPPNASEPCDALATGLDVVGLVCARLARFDLGICLLFATRGESAWLFRATGGWLGLPEAVPLHRTAGWWCAGQSALHSAAYLGFYPWTAGLSSLWLNCFPAATPVPGGMNRLGLVNFFGVVALIALLLVVVPALPYFRRRSYDVFQRLHLPASALFIVCCALHDLPILIFAVPGIADWLLGWRGVQQRGGSFPLVLPARVRLLAGTSAPWVELTVDCAGTDLLGGLGAGGRRPVAPRGEWALVRVVPLGGSTSAHPLSVAVHPSCTEMSALVTGKAGDWSRQLAALAETAYVL